MKRTLKVESTSKTLNKKEERIRCPTCMTLTPLSRLREVQLPCDCGKCKQIMCQECFSIEVQQGKIEINKKVLLSNFL
jgi:hypothetical protein